MDRLMDDDETPTIQHGAGPGRVARLGMAGFVRAHEAGAPPHIAGVEVVQSRREQRHAAAAAAMPPPRTLSSSLPDPHQTTTPTATTSSSSSGFSAPPWAVAPPAGLVLQVLKDGALVQEVALQQSATVFGRLPNNDVVLDHASISRQHAALCFAGPSISTSTSKEPTAGAAAAADGGSVSGTSSSPQGGAGNSSGSACRCLVLDLGSAHGTWVNGQRCSKGVPVELAPGVLLHFGASSRRYQLRCAGPPQQPPSSWQQQQQVVARTSPSRKRRAEACPLDDHCQEQQQQQGTAPLALLQAAPQQPHQQQQPRAAKRAKRVTFRDEVTPSAPAAAAAAEVGQPLAQVIGYTDGSTFQPQVGPVPAASSSDSLFGNGPTSYLLTPAAAAAGGGSSTMAAAGSIPRQHSPAVGADGVAACQTSPLAAAVAGGGGASPRAQPAKQRPAQLKELERREGQALRAGRQVQQDPDERGEEEQDQGVCVSSPTPATAAAAAAALALGGVPGPAVAPHGVAGALEDDHHMPDAEEQDHCPPQQQQQQQARFRVPAPLQVSSNGTASAAAGVAGAAPCSPRGVGPPSSSRSPRAALGVPGSPRLSPSGAPAGLGMKAVSLAGLAPGRPTAVTTTTTTAAASSSSSAAAAARSSAAGLRAGLQLFQQQVALAKAASLEAGAGSPRNGTGQQQGGLYAGLVLPEGVQWQQ